jgi:hypothetical protein
MPSKYCNQATIGESIEDFMYAAVQWFVECVDSWTVIITFSYKL